MKINTMKMMFLSPEDEGSGGGGTQTTSQSGAGSLIGESGTSGGTTETTTSGTTSWLNDKGEFTEGWLDRLPDDLKEAKVSLSKFKDLTGLLKSTASLEKMLGKKGDAVNIPSPDASPEEKAAFYKQLGRPDSADVYTTKPKNLPEGLEWNEDFAKQINALAHEEGVLPSAMEKIISKYAEFEINRGKESAAKELEAFNAYKKNIAEAWGDKFATNDATTTRMAQTLGLPKDTREWTPDKVVIAIHRASQLVSEDRLVPLDSVATTQPGAVRSQDIMTNPANPLYAAYHGKQGPAKQKVAANLVLDLIKNG